MPDDIKNLFAGIPENAKICIWGAANAGRSIKEELAKYRQDTTVCAFIDSVKQGEIDGVKIYKPENMPEIKNNFDYMIISTRSDCTVIDAMLFYYDIKNYVRISPYLLKKYQFIPSKISEILNFLDSEKDKQLYKDLIEARITGNTDKLKEFVQKEHNITPDRKRTIKHYTSYINYDAIEVVLEGGMFNGLNTIVFKKLFKNLKKIYAFELIYDKVKNKSIAHIIDSLKDKNGSEQNFTVDAISIDEYVSENNIEKVDFIKMDIEGAEMKALKGAEQTLIKHRPQLAISIYHSNNDMQDIPIYLHNILKNYIFKIGQYSPDNDETILYAIPEELYVK